MIQTNNLAKIDKIQTNNLAKSKKSKEIIYGACLFLNATYLKEYTVFVQSACSYLECA